MLVAPPAAVAPMMMEMGWLMLDTGCASASDNDERSCNDSVDNDGDG